MAVEGLSGSVSVAAGEAETIRLKRGRHSIVQLGSIMMGLVYP